MNRLASKFEDIYVLVPIACTDDDGTTLRAEMRFRCTPDSECYPDFWLRDKRAVVDGEDVEPTFGQIAELVRHTRVCIDQYTTRAAELAAEARSR